MSVRLVISTEEGVSLEFKLGSQPVRIGRAKDNTIKSADKRTSRHHAVIRRLPDSDDYEIEDAGSSYGSFLNGRPIKKERLKHQDLLRLGGLIAQLQRDDQDEEEAGPADPSIMSAALDNLFEARGQIRQLIEQQAHLRQEVGIAQEAEDRAKKLRDEAQDEVERVHGMLHELRKENVDLDERIEAMGRELRELRSARSAQPAADLAQVTQQRDEATRAAERLKARVAELEERELNRAVTEQASKKELERLTEQLKRRDQREHELTAAVKPALLRIAELSKELEKTQFQLAKVEADLAAQKKR